MPDISSLIPTTKGSVKKDSSRLIEYLSEIQKKPYPVQLTVGTSAGMLVLILAKYCFKELFAVQQDSFVQK